MAWTEEKRKLVCSQYTETMNTEYDSDESRAAATTEVCAELAEIHGESVNGVVTILSRAKVYFKKSAVTKKKPAAGTTTRVNKAEAIATLTSLIKDVDPDNVDEDLISKLTGKAAMYLSGVLQKALADG